MTKICIRKVYNSRVNIELFQPMYIIKFNVHKMYASVYYYCKGAS